VAEVAQLCRLRHPCPASMSPFVPRDTPALLLRLPVSRFFLFARAGLLGSSRKFHATHNAEGDERPKPTARILAWGLLTVAEKWLAL